MMNLRVFSLLIITFLLSLNLAAQQKKIVLEIFEGTWCDACPQAIEIVDGVLANHPNVIPVALHFGDQDPMNVDAAYQIASIFTGASAPGFMIDRNLFPNEANVALPIESNLLNNYLNERLSEQPVVSVNLNNGNFDPATRILSIDVNAEFQANLTLSIFNMNLFIVEDLIQTNDPAYNQAGAGSNYPHKYVLRAMLGGEWGTYGAIDQSTVTPGDAFSYSYLTQIPNDWDISKLQIIGLVQQSQQVQNFDMRPILNADNIALSSLLVNTDIEELEQELTINIHPNPTNSNVEVNFKLNQANEYKVQITDALGRIVKQHSNSFAIGNQTLSFDLSGEASGTYIIKIYNNEKSFSRLITKH